MPNPLTTLIREQEAAFVDHPAMKFANNTIALSAIRSGGTGYTGDENLAQWLRKSYITLLEAECERLKKEKMVPVEVPHGSPYLSGFNNAITIQIKHYKEVISELKSS